VLTVKIRGRSIGDVLQMTVDEAVDFFSAHDALARRLGATQERARYGAPHVEHRESNVSRIRQHEPSPAEKPKEFNQRSFCYR